MKRNGGEVHELGLRHAVKPRTAAHAPAGEGVRVPSYQVA
jgi:hypothetical protein